MTSLSRSGEATLSRSASQHKVPKPRLAAFIPDFEADTQSIMVNFSGIHDYITQTQPNLDTKSFNKKYASMVNDAIRKCGLPMVLFNLVHLTLHNNPHMISEFFAKTIADATTVLNFAFNLLVFGIHGDLNASNFIAIIGMMGLFNIASFDVINLASLIMGYRDKSPDAKNIGDEHVGKLYARYLMKRDGSWPAKLLFPLNVVRELDIPLIHAFSKKKLIKAAE